jgi:hypothetical protein
MQSPENNKRNEIDKYGCFSITLWLLSLFVSLYCFILYISSGQEIWIWNRSDKDILITNCYLNKKSLDECAGKLSKHQTRILEPSTILYSPKQNHFSMSFNKNQIEYKYTCDFYRKKTDCQEEIIISNKGVVCEKYCSSVYN